jgi:HSP20 family protein
MRFGITPFRRASAPLSVWDSEFDRLFEDFFRAPANSEATGLNIPVDIKETEKAIELHADLPGFEREQVKVEIEGGVLRISGERNRETVQDTGAFHRAERVFGKFVRHFTLPETVDAEKAQAEFKNGVLTLTLPKREASKSKQIEIKIQ